MVYFVRQHHRAPAVHDRRPPDPGLPRACIIGAGPSGITAAKALTEARVPFDCFEMGEVIGGNWVLDNPNGQSACYSTLEINTSCPRMAYSDFPMPAGYPAYAKHWQVRAYLDAYVDHFALRDAITFRTKVEAVTRRPDGVWLVSISGPGGRETREYDSVLVGNGHHWDARWPEPAYPGSFDGDQLHAHDYHGPEQLAGRDVLVVGMGSSALDVAADASQVARSTTMSVRRGQHVLRKTLAGRAVDQILVPTWAPHLVRTIGTAVVARLSGDLTRYGLPKPRHRAAQSHPAQSDRFHGQVRAGRIRPRPGIERLAGDRVVFTDGTESPVDLIVWCTGYRVTFPFLDPALVSAPDNDLPLWKRMVHPDLPGLYFIGLAQPVGAIMPIAEAQARWAAALLSGRCALPAPEEVRSLMTAEHRANQRHFYASQRHTMEVDFDRYLADLAREQRRGAARVAAGAQAAVSRLAVAR